jgi:hypothetical protein
VAQISGKFILNATVTLNKLNQGGATTGQAIVWSGSAWVPTTVSSVDTKAGRVAAGTFAGNPKKATVTFATAFANTNYAIAITGADARTWTIESKLAGSFVINSNSNTAPTSETMWQAQPDRNP